MSEIKFFNRYTKKDEVEKVYGDVWLEWLYGNPLGRVISHIAALPFVSKAYGSLQDTAYSAQKIEKFINDFKIPMEEYEKGPFHSFNEFFIRKFLSGKRSFPQSSNEMGAFAEARYHGWDAITESQSFPVKGKELSAAKIINNEKWSKVFEGGPLMIARLCPVDYHRFHFPFSGKIVDHFPVKGKLYTVNPIVFNYMPSVFSDNERYVTILENEQFGKIAYVEVGATMVGKIVQSHNLTDSFNVGDEKGYFLFGGSTVIVLGEKGKWKPSSDITSNTASKKETYIHLGDVVAKSL